MCGCPDGHVLDEGVCVPENSCGCINIAGAYAAVGSQQHVGSEECTCNEGGEYECVDLGCPCDAFDEECMDFVCAEPTLTAQKKVTLAHLFLPRNLKSALSGSVKKALHMKELLLFMVLILLKRPE